MTSIKKLLPLITSQKKVVDDLQNEQKELDKKGGEKSKDKEVKARSKKVAEELKPAKKKLDEMEASHEEAGKALGVLNERLRALTGLVATREKFQTWWDKEEAKMTTLVDKARDLSKDAEEACKKAGAAVKEGDIPTARAAGQEADKAAKEAAVKADAAVKLFDGWTTPFNAQRNYETSHMPKEDVASYAALTKKVYEVFATANNLNRAALRWQEEARLSAQTAADFVASGGDLVAANSKGLDTALKTMRAEAEDLRVKTERTWGKTVMEKGKQFVTMRQNFEKNPEGMRVAASKAVEQAEGILPGELAAFKKAVATLEQQQAKTLDRLPQIRLLRRHVPELKAQVEAVQELVEWAQQTRNEFEKNYEVAVAELEKLKKAVG